MDANLSLFCRFSLAALCAVAFTARAADFYVSSDKSYGVAEGADPGHIFDDLQQAINAAEENDTVWVEDGFVCESGVTNATVNKATVQTRLRVDKALTITSRSGDWRTGAVIRGKYADGYDPTKSTRETIDKTKSGVGAVSCVVCASRSVVFRGFRVTNGATSNVEKFGGGAQSGTFTNCLFSSCAAYMHGGACNSSTVEDCVISNCCAATTASATPRGGGAADSVLRRCLVVDCYSSGQGGGMGGSTAYDCTIFKCSSGYGGAARDSHVYRSLMHGCSASNSGGAGYQAYFYDCIVSNCTASTAGGAASMYVLDGTLFVENGGTCVLNIGNASELITNCTVIAKSGAALSALKTVQTSGQVVDCTLVSLNGVGVKAGNDNGNAGINLRRCTVTVPQGQYATKCEMSTKYPQQTRVLNAWDCTFNGGLSGCGNYYNCQVKDATTSAALVNNNVQITVGDKQVNQPINLYNCTICGNDVTGGRTVGGYEVHAVNTILRGNVGAEKADELTSAVNCCLEDDATVGEETGCVRADPLLMTGDGGFLYPSEASPCRNGGSLTAYELPEMDLAGHPRTSNDGTTVAIGACEFDPNLVGVELSVILSGERVPLTSLLSASCSGLGTDGLVYYWDFNGDGVTDEVTDAPSLEHVYHEAGVFVPTVAISNAVRGASASVAEPVEVLEGFYVSTKDIHSVPGREGCWGVYTTADGYLHTAYTNLQQAIDAADAGSTVWVDADFVCNEGSKLVGKVPRRIYVNKALTVRGESGDWRTGPTIHGSYATTCDGTEDTRCGAGAVACVGGHDVSLVVFEGIRLVGGATPASNDDTTYGGGAWRVTLRNCLVKDCAASYAGGAASGCRTEACRVEGCRISGNTKPSRGGAYFEGTHTNDVVVGCSTSSNGGAGYDASFYCCTISNCSAATYGGAARGGEFGGCTVCGCFVSGSGGGGSCAYKATLRDTIVTACSNSFEVMDCSLYGCRLENSGSSAAQVRAGNVVSNCVVTGIRTSPAIAVIATGTSARIVDSVISNNFGTAVDVHVKDEDGVTIKIENCYVNCTNVGYYAARAGRVKATSKAKNSIFAKNTVFEGPVTGRGEYYNCRIGGERSTFPAASCSETDATYTDETYFLKLFNCTVTGHTSTKTAGGAEGYVVAVNSIIRGNTGKAGMTDALFAATNSCLEADATAGEEVGCVRVNPRFHRDPELKYIPRASALRGKSVVFDWMSDPEDIRSVDLRGEPRLADGAADIGAYQMLPPIGLMLMVR